MGELLQFFKVLSIEPGLLFWRFFVLGELYGVVSFFPLIMMAKSASLSNFFSWSYFSLMCM